MNKHNDKQLVTVNSHLWSENMICATLIFPKFMAHLYVYMYVAKKNTTENQLITAVFVTPERLEPPTF